MQTFIYPKFFRFLYRYGNIPANILMLFYLYVSASGLDINLLNIIPLLLNLGLMYLLNKNYLVLYKILPYRIDADDEKIICSDYIFSPKRVTIFHKNISALKGGVFEKKATGLMKVHDGQTGRVIGFYNNLKNADKLQTILLRNVQKNVYDAVVEKTGLSNNDQSTK